MKFQVLDNNKPADSTTIPSLVVGGWDQSIYDTFDEALEYARKWLGGSYGGSNDGKTGLKLELNKSHDYYMGCEIIIVEYTDLVGKTVAYITNECVDSCVQNTSKIVFTDGSSLLFVARLDCPGGNPNVPILTIAKVYPRNTT